MSKDLPLPKGYASDSLWRHREDEFGPSSEGPVVQETPVEALQRRVRHATDNPLEPRAYGLNEYQVDSARTMAGQPDLILAALGLTGEAGEFADLIKKWYAHGHALDRDKLISELGDILWYVARAADALGCGLSYVARQNNEKLKARYPDGFTTEQSLNR